MGRTSLQKCTVILEDQRAYSEASRSFREIRGASMYSCGGGSRGS